MQNQRIARAAHLMEEALEILDEELRRCRASDCEYLSQILWLGLKVRIMLSMYAVREGSKKLKRAVGA
ncbi:MAG: hypothetical protein DRO12_01295 [Thermoprotei archaeon]|nr:MAG: hypothetical protein DRO12_01295 [Thermoprotei archaeon]